MTTAEINIWIRTRAKEARVVLQAVKRDLERMAAAGANAGGVMDALSGASAGYAVNMRNANTQAAALARSLSLINKSGAPAAKHMLNLGVAAELLPPAFRNAAIQSQSFKTALDRLAISARNAAAPVAQLGTASKSLSAMSNFSARGVKNIMDLGIAAELAGPAMAQAASAAAKLNTALQGVTVSANRAAAALRAFNAAAGVAATGATKYAKGTQSAAASASAAAAQFGAASATAGAAASSAAAMGAASATAASGIGSLAGGVRTASDGAAHLDNSLWKASDRIRKIGSQAQWTGRQLSVMFTMPTMLAVGLGTAWALEYEKAFTRMKKVYNGELADLGGEGPEFKGSKFDRFFTALSNRLGHAREDLAEVGAAFAQAGLTGAQLAKAVELTGEFSILGDQDLDQSATDLIALMAQYKMSVDEARLAVAHLNAISNETPVSMAQLTSGFGRTASVAREFGVDVRQLGAFLAALTPAAGPIAQTSNGMKSILTRLATPANDALEVLEKVGIQVDTVEWQSKNAVDRLVELSKAFEGLSQQQKMDFAKPFAGMYQINRFIALMSDLADEQGNYATALKATETSAKSLEIYQRELNTFLQSNPQQLKIAGQVIKNSLGDAIAPLVPWLVYLAKALAKVMQGFSNLSPATQKFIVLSAVALAAVGPLAMLLGSFAILFGVIGKSVYWAGAAFKFLLGPVGKLAPKLGYLRLMAMGLWGELVKVGSALGSVFRAAAAGGTIQHVGGFFSRMLVQATAFAGRMFGIIAGALGRIAPFLLRTVAPQIAKAAGIALAGLSGPIGWAIAGILTLIMLFPKQTWAAVKGVAQALVWPFIQGGKLIWKSLQGIGRLVSAAFQAVREVVQRVGSDNGIPIAAKPFVIAVEIVGKALAALPRLVVAVFQGVVRVIQRAAMAVYDAFSYINPFARHSPSLVENVTGGMAIVKDEFSAMADSVAKDTMRAYKSISNFGQAAAGVKVRAADFEREEKREQFTKADPSGAAWAAYSGLGAEAKRLEERIESLNDAFDAQEKVVKEAEAAVNAQEKTIKSMEKGVKAAEKNIKVMEKSLDALKDTANSLKDALDEAQERLDYYSNAQILGTRAMSDAIFENELAQKRLRLEIMKLEDAGQSVDDLTDRFSRLQGQLETLMGEREELRQKGAGSDILSVYDQMLADIEAQMGETAGEKVAPLQKAQEELERLQREGERLDLENALKFDPLNRQIEQLLDNTQELSFEQIVGGIVSNKAAVDGLTIAYESANRAVEGQEAAIANAEAARDAMNEAIELQEEKLTLLNEALDAEKEKLDMVKDAQDQLKDALSAVEEEMSDIEQAVQTVVSALEEMERKAKEAKEAMDEFDNSWEIAGMSDFEVGDVGDMTGLENYLDETDIDDMTARLTEEVANMFEGIDIGAAIGGFFNRIGEWFKSLPGRFVGWLGDCAVSIGSTIMGWGTSAWEWLANLGSTIGGFFGGLWSNHIWPALSQIPGFIANFLINLPTMLVEGGAYLAGWFTGLFVKLGAMIYVLGREIANYFTGGGFTEDLRNVWDAISRWWTEDVWQPFVRFITETLPDVGESIWNYFTGGGFTEDLAGIWDSFRNWWSEDVWQPFVRFLTEGIPDIGEAILNYFTGGGFWEDVTGVVDTIWEFAVSIYDGFIDGLKSAFSNIGNWLYEHIWTPFLNGVKDVLGIHSPSTVFADFGINLIEGLWEGIKSLGGWFKDKFLAWAKDHIPGPIADFLGINSPSRMFMEMGGYIAEGLAIGIQQGGSKVDAAATSLAQAALAGAATPVAPPTDPLAATVDVYDAAMGTISANTTATQAQMHAAMVAAETSYTSVSQSTYAAHSAAVGAEFSALSLNLQSTMSSMSDALIGKSNDTAKGLDEAFRNGADAVALATQTMTEVATSNFQSLATNLASIMTDQIVPIFDSFGPMLDTVVGWFGETVDNIGTTWAKVQEPVAIPARFIVNDVYNGGIRSAWNSFNSFLDLDPLPEHVARFATGGKVAGAGTSVSDSIPALLSNGEHVVTAREVRGAGGHQAIEQARAMWRSGVPAFAKGGPVDVNAAPWPGGGGEANLQPAAILARRNIHKYWPEVTEIGGYRAQDPYPDHPSGLALDVMVGNRYSLGDEIEAWLHKYKDDLALNYTIWKQFYRPAGGVGNMMEDRGSVTQNHWDHIHALFNANGLAGGISAVGAKPMYEIIEEHINRTMDDVASRAPQVAGGIGKWPLTAVEKARKQLLDFMVPLAKEKSLSSSPGGMIGNAESWRAMAIEAMKRNGFNWQDERQVQAMLRQIMSESSGDPRAIQQVIDVNSGGNEAQGLLQVTPRTWRAYRDPELPDDPFDPWANMNAALRYYKSKYGLDLTTHWGRGHGYDKGGWLEPTPAGFGTYYNHTGAPEAVLTQSDWNAIYEAANNPVDTEMISDGVLEALTSSAAQAADRKQALQVAEQISSANSTWTPAIYGAADAADEAVKELQSGNKTAETGLERFSRIGNQINSGIQDLSSVMLSIASALQTYNETGQLNFEMIAPILTAVAGLIEKLPDVDAEYVPWAGTDYNPTAQEKAQKAANDAANFGKGVYLMFRDVAPALLKHTASIGTGISTLIASQGPIIAAALAMAPANPIGAAIMALPAILTGIFTILPQIIAAITEIVPLLIQSLIRLFSRFMPDSVYAYDTLEEAEKAASENLDAIRKGATAPYFEVPVSQQTNQNQQITINVANVTVQAKDQNSADQFVSNLQVLASN